MSSKPFHVSQNRLEGSLCDETLGELLDSCRKHLVTGTIRITRGKTQGVVELRAGMIDRASWGQLVGDNAVVTMRSLRDGMYELTQRLPDLTGDLGDAAACEADLSQVSLARIMRHCEDQALSCAIHVLSDRHRAELHYKVGELIDYSLDGRRGEDVIVAIAKLDEGRVTVKAPPLPVDIGGWPSVSKDPTEPFRIEHFASLPPRKDAPTAGAQTARPAPGLPGTTRPALPGTARPLPGTAPAAASRSAPEIARMHAASAAPPIARTSPPPPPPPARAVGTGAHAAIARTGMPAPRRAPRPTPPPPPGDRRRFARGSSQVEVTPEAPRAPVPPREAGSGAPEAVAPHSPPAQPPQVPRMAPRPEPAPHPGAQERPERARGRMHDRAGSFPVPAMPLVARATTRGETVLTGGRRRDLAFAAVFAVTLACFSVVLWLLASHL